MMLAVACVRTTVREFFPSPDNPRYTQAQGSAAVREYLRIRCPELAKPPARDSATLSARIRVDSSGKAIAAVLNESSGDAVMDGVIGTVLAQLDLSAQTPAPRLPEYAASVAYSCRDAVAARIDVTP